MIKTIDKYRRKTTQFLTQNLGKNSYIEAEPQQIKRILVIRPNHRLGNILLITPLLDEITLHFPNATIDLFVKGKVSEILFENHPKIGRILALPKNHFKEILTYISTWFKILTKKYDLVVSANHSSSSGQLATKLARGKFKFYGEEKENSYELLNDYSHFAKFPVYNFRAYLSKTWPDLCFSEISPLTIKLIPEEIEKGKNILSEITKNQKKTIAFFTYASGEKCFSKEFWSEMYAKMQLAFEPHYNLIEVLPIENLSQIDFKAKSYYSKDIREVAAFLSHTELFIGADSGMMHLATTSTTTIGLFNSTPKEKYQPYCNSNIGIDMNKMSTDECIALMQKLITLVSSN